MNQGQTIPQHLFEQLFREKLGEHFERALKLFVDCGEHVSVSVTNTLLHAADKEPSMVEKVLDEMEKHYNDHLAYQHPEIRGTVVGSSGMNETEVFFRHLYQNILCLEPVSASVDTAPPMRIPEGGGSPVR